MIDVYIYIYMYMCYNCHLCAIDKSPRKSALHTLGGTTCLTATCPIGPHLISTALLF